MCDSFDDNCTGCELYKSSRSDLICRAYIFNHPEKAVAIVERWAKDHPRKTRQSEFLKMFPRADVAVDGMITFCPESMDSEFECLLKKGGDRGRCTGCRKKYWLEEVEK